MGGSKARGSCNDRLDYITKEEKTEEKLIFTKDCSEDNFKKDFEDIKQIWDKTEGRQYYHLVQSFEKEDYISLENAHEIGKKFIENNEVSNKDIAEIIIKTMRVFIFFENKEKLILELKEYWNLYKDKPLNERPLFLTPLLELWK